MEEKITIKNRGGYNLSAILHIPENKTDKIVIITHSFKGDKNVQPILRDFSRRAEKEGYAVLRFDCYGSGESEGKFEDSSISTQVNDLKDIISFVKSKNYKNICLIGLSLGTKISILAYDKSIKCLILWSPSFELKSTYNRYKEEIIKQGYATLTNRITGKKSKLGKKMWKEFGAAKPLEKLEEIDNPVLAILGTEDKFITPEKAEEYMALIPGKHKLEVIIGGDHDYLVKEAEEKAISLSIDFIKKNL